MLRKIKENLDSDQDLQTPNLTVFTLLQEEEKKKHSHKLAQKCAAH